MKMKNTIYDRFLLWLQKKLSRHISHRNRVVEDPKKVEERRIARRELRRANRKSRSEAAAFKKLQTAHTAICYTCKATFIYKGMKISNYCGGCVKKQKPNLREKEEAHKWFDVLWTSGRMTREEAYLYISNLMALPREYCHIGMFNKDQCLLLQVKLAQSEHSDLFH